MNTRFNCGHYASLEEEKLGNAISVPYPCPPCKAARKARAEVKRNPTITFVIRDRVLIVKKRVTSIVVMRP